MSALEFIKIPWWILLVSSASNICNIVQEAVIKTIPQEKERKKWLSEEKRREAKVKGIKET